MSKQNIVEKLNRDVVKVMAATDVRERYVQRGVDPQATPRRSSRR